MPSVKDYDSKKKKARRRPGRELSEDIAASADDAEAEAELETETRLSREEEVEQAEEIEVDEPVAKSSASKFAEETDETSEDTSFERHSHDDRKKIHIEFPYSELVRAKVPKAFDVAETVAEEWVNDGTFENIPVGHPLAQITVAAGLRKAKEVEKKLEEKGVFAMAKMGLEYAKSKLKK